MPFDQKATMKKSTAEKEDTVGDDYNDDDETFMKFLVLDGSTHFEKLVYDSHAVILAGGLLASIAALQRRCFSLPDSVCSGAAPRFTASSCLRREFHIAARRNNDTPLA